MYFIVEEVVRKVRAKLAEPDPDNSFFSNNDVIKSISDSLSILARDLEIPNTIITINVVKGVKEYVIPDSEKIEEIYEVWQEGEVGNPLKYIEFDDAIKLDNKTSSTLWYYYVYDAVVNNVLNTYIGLYPIPETNTTIKLRCLTFTSPLTSLTDKIPLPRRYLTLLCYLVLADLLEQDKRYEEAGYYLARYKDRLTIERVKLKGRTPEYVE